MGMIPRIPSMIPGFRHDVFLVSYYTTFSYSLQSPTASERQKTYGTKLGDDIPICSMYGIFTYIWVIYGVIMLTHMTIST